MGTYEGVLFTKIESGTGSSQFRFCVHRHTQRRFEAFVSLVERDIHVAKGAQDCVCRSQYAVKSSSDVLYCPSVRRRPYSIVTTGTTARPR